MKSTRIREALAEDLAGISSVVLAAFPGAAGMEVCELVFDLLKDPTASPLISLVAVDGSRVVGHILLTPVGVDASSSSLSALILAPLCVAPDCQNRGVGGELIRGGLQQAKERGAEAVFVLGHPGYYCKHGFAVAGSLGFSAPYPIPAQHAEAWRVAELKPGILSAGGGQVRCADALMDPKYWRE